MRTCGRRVRCLFPRGAGAAPKNCARSWIEPVCERLRFRGPNAPPAERSYYLRPARTRNSDARASSILLELEREDSDPRACFNAAMVFKVRRLTKPTGEPTHRAELFYLTLGDLRRLQRDGVKIGHLKVGGEAPGERELQGNLHVVRMSPEDTATRVVFHGLGENGNPRLAPGQQDMGADFKDWVDRCKADIMQKPAAKVVFMAFGLSEGRSQFQALHDVVRTVRVSFLGTP